MALLVELRRLARDARNEAARALAQTALPERAGWVRFHEQAGECLADRILEEEDWRGEFVLAPHGYVSLAQPEPIWKQVFVHKYIHEPFRWIGKEFGP